MYLCRSKLPDLRSGSGCPLHRKEEDACSLLAVHPQEEGKKDTALSCPFSPSKLMGLINEGVERYLINILHMEGNIRGIFQTYSLFWVLLPWILGYSHPLRGKYQQSAHGVPQVVNEHLNPKGIDMIFVKSMLGPPTGSFDFASRRLINASEQYIWYIGAETTCHPITPVNSLFCFPSQILSSLIVQHSLLAVHNNSRWH